jgi:hypothetical protein
MMLAVNLAGVSFRRSVAIWSVTLVAYVGSCIVELVFLHSVLRQPGRLVGGIGVLVAGPILAALLYERPPPLLLATLVPIYYVVVALSVSTYDEPRWNSSRMWAGVFNLLIQLIAVAIAILVSRRRRSSLPRPTTEA